jgi:hypothetical protein
MGRRGPPSDNAGKKPVFLRAQIGAIPGPLSLVGLTASLLGGDDLHVRRNDSRTWFARPPLPQRVDSRYCRCLPDVQVPTRAQ